MVEGVCKTNEREREKVREGARKRERRERYIDGG